MAVGAYAWHRGPDRRFGLVLIAAGAGWAVTTLAETDDSLAYPVGRTAGWVVELLVALGGDVDVASTPGAGTAVHGRVPTR